MAEVPEKPASGLILGKFLPPHRGHQYLVEFGRHYVGRLTVLVCSLQSEPIPGALRQGWMREMFPHVDVVHVTDENPQEPHEHPRFWEIWTETVLRHAPRKPDVVFTSEAYGFELARRLGAEHVPVDLARELVPISGTEIRADPLAAWDHLPEPVRAHYVKRVAVVGPESTGKTTLARDLARHYRTVWASEYARGYLESVGADRGLTDPEAVTDLCTAADIERIARGQIASEDALVRQANRVLFSDTDLATTEIYRDLYFGGCPDWIRAAGEERRHDLFLVCAPDVPWVADAQRDLPHRREELFETFVQRLRVRGCAYRVVRGGWEERFKQARQAVDEMLGACRLSKGPPGA
jgi:HTH-type transcriptional repressor of NAD biosynthesis genes